MTATMANKKVEDLQGFLFIADLQLLVVFLWSPEVQISVTVLVIISL